MEEQQERFTVEYEKLRKEKEEILIINRNFHDIVTTLKAENRDIELENVIFIFFNYLSLTDNLMLHIIGQVKS